MHASPEDIARAVTLVREGRLVAFPTETVYGLGADAFNAGAVERVFCAKGRPATNPLIVHVVDEAMAQRVCAEWPATASTLAARFWPGPLTLVLPKTDQVPGIVTADGPTVALRCPSHPLTLALLETLGSPMVGPSANRSGYISPTCAAHVRESFDEGEVFILDGGPCAGGIESTVFDLTQSPPCVLRPGLLSAEDLAETLGVPIAEPSPRAHNEHNRSPGLHPSHYAPLTPTRLIEPGSLERELQAVSDETFAVVLGPDTLGCALMRPDTPPPHHFISMPSEPTAYAARLYAALHKADSMAPGVILVVQPWPDESPTGLWLALADRLRRATSPR